MAYTITDVQSTEYAEWADLWKKYLEFYKTSLPESQYKSTFARICDPDGDLYGLILRDASGKAVGISIYLFHASSWTDRNFCYLNDLYVEPECRGKGYGRNLIEETRKKSLEKNSARLYWTTAPDNATARRLYDTVAITDRVVYKINN